MFGGSTTEITCVARCVACVKVGRESDPAGVFRSGHAGFAVRNRQLWGGKDLVGVFEELFAHVAFLASC